MPVNLESSVPALPNWSVMVHSSGTTFDTSQIVGIRTTPGPEPESPVCAKACWIADSASVTVMPSTLGMATGRAYCGQDWMLYLVRRLAQSEFVVVVTCDLVAVALGTTDDPQADPRIPLKTMSPVASAQRICRGSACISAHLR